MDTQPPPSNKHPNPTDKEDENEDEQPPKKMYMKNDDEDELPIPRKYNHKTGEVYDYRIHENEEIRNWLNSQPEISKKRRKLERSEYISLTRAQQKAYDKFVDENPLPMSYFDFPRPYIEYDTPPPTVIGPPVAPTPPQPPQKESTLADVYARGRQEEEDASKNTNPYKPYIRGGEKTNNKKRREKQTKKCGRKTTNKKRGGKTIKKIRRKC